MKKSEFFWVSYSDLMTSLFFVMLVLYIITLALLQVEIGKMEADQQKLKEIENVVKALQKLDKRYFEFDEENKRYKLNVDVTFAPNRFNIYDREFISNEQRQEIVLAGQSLYDSVEEIISKNKDIDYLLIIEGNTQRYNNNWENFPDGGYVLSYKRALELYNYWKSKNIDFRKLGGQCEVILAGSGYFGQSRDNVHEYKNRKFTIQITSKVGKFLKNENNE